MPNMRKGFRDATFKEKLWLLEMETWAKQMALQETVDDLLSGNRSPVSHAPDLRVVTSQVAWFRSRGRLFVRIRVVLAPGRIVCSFKWRSPLLATAGDPAFRPTSPKPLKLGPGSGNVAGRRSGSGGAQGGSSAPPAGVGVHSVAAPERGQFLLFPLCSSLRPPVSWE